MAALPVILIALLLWPVQLFAATATMTCSNALTSTNWANPGNIFGNADGDAYTMFNATSRDFLSIDSCVPLPSGSTAVTGVQVRLIGCGTGGTTGARQVDINLLNVGTCTAKTGLTQAACPTWTDQTVGGTSDTWSCTAMTPANVENNAFGVTIRDTNTSAAELREQYVEIIVTYTPGTTTTTTTTATTTTTLVGGTAARRRMM